MRIAGDGTEDEPIQDQPVHQIKQKDHACCTEARFQAYFGVPLLQKELRPPGNRANRAKTATPSRASGAFPQGFAA